MLGFGTVLVLSIAAGASAVAGPGPQYSQQQENLRNENVQKAKVAAVKPPEGAGMACSSCKTKIYQEAALPNVADKSVPRVVKVGWRHYCGDCSGTITRFQSRMADEMARNHSLCATAAANCCRV